MFPTSEQPGPGGESIEKTVELNPATITANVVALREQLATFTQERGYIGSTISMCVDATGLIVDVGGYSDIERDELRQAKAIFSVTIQMLKNPDDTRTAPFLLGFNESLADFMFRTYASKLVKKTIQQSIVAYNELVRPSIDKPKDASGDSTRTE